MAPSGALTRAEGRGRRTTALASPQEAECVGVPAFPRPSSPHCTSLHSEGAGPLGPSDPVRLNCVEGLQGAWRKCWNASGRWLGRKHQGGPAVFLWGCKAWEHRPLPPPAGPRTKTLRGLGAGPSLLSWYLMPSLPGGRTSSLGQERKQERLALLRARPGASLFLCLSAWL